MGWQHNAGNMFKSCTIRWCITALLHSAKTHTKDGRVLGAVPSNGEYEELWVKDGGLSSIRLLDVKNTPANRLFEIRP
jgi:hypothetical protein